MNNFNFMFSFELPTKIFFGPGVLAELPNVLKSLNIKKPLIITDSGIVAAGIVGKVTDALSGFEFSVFDEVEANPKDKNVEKSALAYKNFGADSIIAVGGGSPIDCAKAAAVLIANNADDISHFYGKGVKSNPLPPLVCVPTTSGTGSELTFSSVITDTKNNQKMTVKNEFTAPKAAVCDPCLTLSVPKSITAATGIDALTHAIEAYTATCAEPISDAVALYAIELIYGSLRTAYENGNDIEARSKMLMGSMLAGIAFSHSDVASVHCIAETLGGMYNLPHGVCNAVILPFMMEYNMDYCKEKYARIARAMGVSDDTGAEGAMAAVSAVKKLAADVALPPFSSFAVPEEAFSVIAEASVKNISTESNPRPMAKEDYLNVLNKMMAQ